MSEHCHVLLVEDNPAQVALTEAIVHSAGLTVKVASNGADAVEAIKEGTFDLILMDFHMPLLTGGEATMQIRKWEKVEQRLPIPIVGITASAMPHEIDRCLAAGMDRVITKPFDVQMLLDLLKAVCRGVT